MRSKLLSAAAGASTAIALQLRFTLRAPLSEEIEEPVLIASVPSVWIAVVVVAVGAVAGVLLGRFLERVDASNALTPLLVPALALAAYIPGVLGVVPFLSAFGGHFLDLVLLGCVAASLWRVAKRWGISLAPEANRLTLVAFIVFVLLGYHLQETVGISGDEPHYLLITYSLLYDGDLAVENNYGAGDYRRFFNGKIGPHLAHGSSYSVHGVGLPLLLLPGFALLGMRGVLLTEALVGAFLLRELFLLAERVTGNRRGAVLAVIGFGLTAPALFLVVSAYPEVTAALVVVAALRRMVSGSEPGARHAFLWGLVFGLLPFFHIKFLPLATVLCFGTMAFWRKRRWWAAAGLAWGILLLFVYSTVLLGNPNPLASYGRQRVFVERIPLGAAGLLFDQEFGLLPASPFYIVAVVGLGTLLRRKTNQGILALGVLGAVALPGAAHPLWTGGTSPPARFLFPALPLLGVAAAALWSWEPRRGSAPWVQTLLIASLCLAVFMALGPGQPLYLNQRDGTGRIWVALGDSWDLTHYFPSLVRADPRSLGMAVGATLFLVAGAALHWSRRRIILPPVVLLFFLYVVLLDWTFPGRVPEQTSARWMVGLLRELPRREGERFLVLPRAESLSYSEAVDRVDVPIVISRASDSQGWQSPSLFLPAGEYRLDGESTGTLRIFNGPGRLLTVSSGEHFVTRVALAHFHLRADTGGDRFRLRAERLVFSPVLADRSLSLGTGVRVHALDDQAYLDPKGFWTRAGAEAHFALEGDGETSGRLDLVNGGQENWIEIEYRGRASKFSLRPWEMRTLDFPLEQGILLFSVSSASGFRPADLDSSSKDTRMLGVFLTASRF